MPWKIKLKITWTIFFFKLSIFDPTADALWVSLALLIIFRKEYLPRQVGKYLLEDADTFLTLGSSALNQKEKLLHIWVMSLCIILGTGTVLLLHIFIYRSVYVLRNPWIWDHIFLFLFLKIIFGIYSMETGDTGHCELPCRSWELNLGPQQEQWGLLNTNIPGDKHYNFTPVIHLCTDYWPLWKEASPGGSTDLWL